MIINKIVNYILDKHFTIWIVLIVVIGYIYKGMEKEVEVVAAVINLVAYISLIIIVDRL